jgi:diguanylate cyclase (GGDEF)-like protein
MVLAELGAGEVVGELGVLTGMPRSATVVASEPVRTLCIPGGDFLRVVQGAPALATSLLQVLARRIYDTDRRLARYAPDPLTGLLSRTAFREQYGRFAAQARRRQSSVLLMLVDIKSLKGFNDAFGYKVGDEVVRTVAETLLESSRKTDLVARYGGDEFAVLFVDARPDSVEIIVRRIEGTLSRLAVQRDLPAPVTLSFGIALSPDPPEAAEDLIQVADEDMQKRIASQARRTPARSRRAQRTS